MSRPSDPCPYLCADGEPVQPDLFGEAPPAMPAKLSAHPLYSVWRGMVRRCHEPKNPGFKNYGGRGIVVCEEWRSSSRAFIAWAICNGWKPGLQIDREDNDGPYSPGNCRFVTSRVNMNNRRSTRRLSDGTPLADAVRASGRAYSAVSARLHRGLSPDEAISRSDGFQHKLRLSDGTPLVDAARAAGFRYETVVSRVRQYGWTPDEAVSRPLLKRHFLSDGTPLVDAARAAGVAVGTVTARLFHGSTPDEAVSRPLADPRKHFLPDGTPLVDAARAAGLPLSAVYARLRRGWSVQDAVCIPSGGKPVPLRSSVAIEAKAAGLCPGMVRSRLRYGWSLQEALSIPKGGKRPAATAQAVQGESEASALDGGKQAAGIASLSADAP